MSPENTETTPETTQGTGPTTGTTARSETRSPNEGLSREIVRLYARLMGRGPTRTRAYIHEDYALCVLRDVLTRGEQTLVAGGRGEQVIAMRRTLHETLKPELIRIAEEQTGREVTLCVAQFEPEADLALECFLFAPRAEVT